MAEKARATGGLPRNQQEWGASVWNTCCSSRRYGSSAARLLPGCALPLAPIKMNRMLAGRSEWMPASSEMARSWRASEKRCGGHGGPESRGESGGLSGRHSRRSSPAPMTSVAGTCEFSTLAATGDSPTPRSLSTLGCTSTPWGVQFANCANKPDERHSTWSGVRRGRVRDPTENRPSGQTKCRVIAEVPGFWI